MGFESTGNERPNVPGKVEEKNFVPCWVTIACDGAVTIARGGGAGAGSPPAWGHRHRFSFADMTAALAWGEQALRRQANWR